MSKYLESERSNQPKSQPPLHDQTIEFEIPLHYILSNAQVRHENVIFSKLAIQDAIRRYGKKYREKRGNV